MSIKNLNPYLHFNGNADQAIKLYERALGARAEGVQRFNQVPGMNVQKGQEDRIVHALLKIGGQSLMVADTMGQPVHNDGQGNAHVCLDFSDAAELTTAFEALAQGGKVLFPPHDTFYGAKLGMLVDAYGVQWMLNCMKEQPAEPHKIFVNLPIQDLQRSVAFFTKLGFKFNPQFTDEKATCMILSDHAYVMLLTEPFFKTFTKQDVVKSGQTESILALSCSSKAEVDQLTKTALENGGRSAMPPQDQGFMYSTRFYDPDGHHWELVWMDPKAIQ